MEELAKSRNYTNRDEVTVSPDAMGAAYEDKITMFYEEHLHEEEEIRYILKGAGYFDVRDTNDKWVRIRTEPGDLLILPAGIYHRFTVDEENVGLSLSLAHRRLYLRFMFDGADLSAVYQCCASFPEPTQMGGLESRRGNGRESVPQGLL